MCSLSRQIVGHCSSSTTTVCCKGQAVGVQTPVGGREGAGAGIPKLLQGGTEPDLVMFILIVYRHQGNLKR